MTSIVGFTRATDGTNLLVRRWPAGRSSTTGRGFASVLLVHGLGEHSGRYEHVGDQMAASGLDVHAFDQRGNGGSGGPRGSIERWAQLHDDLEGRLSDVRGEAPDMTLALYGHSLGGLLVLGYLLSGRPQPDIAVLSAPGLDSTLPRWKLALAPILGRLLPGLVVGNGINGATLSRDPSVGARLAADPLTVKASTARFAAEALAEVVRVKRAYASLTLPTLVVHGLDDGLVPVRSSEFLAGLPNVERRTYPGARHELHNEPDGSVVIGEIIDWIRGHATIPAEPNIASGERIAR